MLATGADELPLVRLMDISAAAGKHSTQEIENVLAAIGAAWVLGIEPDLIRIGIETFGFNQEKYKPENQNLPIGLQTKGIKL